MLFSRQNYKGMGIHIRLVTFDYNIARFFLENQRCLAEQKKILLI